MLRPEPMARALIVTSSDHAEPVIETLYAARVAQILDYKGGDDTELVFDTGRPLPRGSRASELLVRLRALIRNLDLEDHAPASPFTIEEIEERIASTLDDAEAEVSAVVGRRDELRERLARLDEREAALEPFTQLPLQLEDYRGYERLVPLVGTLNADPSPALEGVDDAITFQGGELLAAFVPRDAQDAVLQELYRLGFKDVPVPSGEGDPADLLAEIARERDELSDRLTEVQAELDVFAERYGDLFVASEEHLAIEVEKAEAPLAFAASENALVVDAWVPASEVAALGASLEEATGGNVHVTFTADLQPSHPTGHVAEEAYGVIEDDVELDEDAEPEPPTRMRNPSPLRPFEYFTRMFATPRYEEIDPTLILGTTFPLFFGFMMGDLGLGLVMTALGWVAMKRLGHMGGMKELGYAIFVSGIVSVLFGAFVFNDALGVTFGFNHHMVEELHAAGMAPACNAQVYSFLGETTWSCLLGLGPAQISPVINRTAEIPFMILLSLLAAFVHLLIGLAFGIRNEAGHGTKHAMAKVGWLVLFLGFFVASLYLISPTTPSGARVWLLGFDSLAIPVIGVATVVAVAILVLTEGALSVLEVPSMLANILSYLRLSALSISHGAMAVAFNGLTLIAALGGLSSGAWLTVILAMVGFVLAQGILFLLGALSAGIQAIRLNFAEFFTKFFEGGGEDFEPFGRERRFTRTT